MYRAKIVLDTQQAVLEFINIANSIKEDVFLEDGQGLTVNAKSLMGVMYSIEFTELYVKSDSPQVNIKFNKYIV